MDIPQEWLDDFAVENIDGLTSLRMTAAEWRAKLEADEDKSEA